MESTRNRPPSEPPARPRQAPPPARSRFDDARPVPYDRYEPTPEEFAAWCAHPITAWVASAWEKAADKQHEQWNHVSWLNGVADHDLLLELRTRADAYRAFVQSGREAYVRSHGS